MAPIIILYITTGVKVYRCFNKYENTYNDSNPNANEENPPINIKNISQLFVLQHDFAKISLLWVISCSVHAPITGGRDIIMENL